MWDNPFCDYDLLVRGILVHSSVSFTCCRMIEVGNFTLKRISVNVNILFTQEKSSSRWTSTFCDDY